jgi:transposase
MSLRPHPISPVPEDTVRIARAAFPKGNPSLLLRDTLGTIFDDADFATLFPACGQPSLPPWRLALVTPMQFRENLADRHAAEAVRAQIDWKDLLGLEIDDPGFDFSVLSEFRDRLLAGHAEHRLLDTLLVHCRAVGLLKARGQQRTDATHVLAAVRALTRLELLGETFHATLNDLATVAPAWVQGIAPLPWYERYGKRIEDTRLPQAEAARTVYAEQVGRDGWLLLDALNAAEVPKALRDRSSVATLRQVWQQHFERLADDAGSAEGPGLPRVRVKASQDTPRAAHQVESPYDVDARYSHKRGAPWIGYTVHLSETCDPTTVHLLTHVHTTPATVHEAMCTATIQQALVDKDCASQEHVVDAAYVDAELLVSSQTAHGITLRGPARPNVNWQTKVEGAYTLADFAVDWEPSRSAVRRGRPRPGGPSAATLHTGQAGRPRHPAPPPGPMGGAAGRAGVVCECGGPRSLQAPCGDRRHPLAGGAGLWAPPCQVSGAPENALAARRDRCCHQYRPHCRMARQAPTGTDAHRPFRRPRSSLRAPAQ